MFARVSRALLLTLTCGVLACSSDDAAPSGSASAGGSSSGGQSPSTMAGTSGSPGGGAANAQAGSAGAINGGSGGGAAGTTGGGAGGSSAGAAMGGTAGGSAGTAPIKLWLAGDSTVQQCSGTCPCGWGSQFDALFNDQVTVVNRAVGGRSIQTWLYEGAVTSTLGTGGECTLTSQTYDKRWRDMLDPSTGMQAGDYLFVQFGINDGDRTCPRHVGVEAFKSYLATMAAAAKERGAQAIFVTPVSAIECSGSRAIATRGFVDETKAAAAKAGVPVIDLHLASIGLYDSLGFCPNDKDYTRGNLGAFFCNDHTHFEAAGAAQIAKLVAEALGTGAPGLAAYLR